MTTDETTEGEEKNMELSYINILAIFRHNIWGRLINEIQGLRFKYFR